MENVYIQIDVNTKNDRYIETFELESTNLITSPTQKLVDVLLNIGLDDVEDYTLQVMKK